VASHGRPREHCSKLLEQGAWWGEREKREDRHEANEQTRQFQRVINALKITKQGKLKQSE
jgi:hypothetical protein